jgi:4-hydroxybenzoyl-CoA thioesterase
MTFDVEYPVRFGHVDHVRVVYYPRFFDFFHRAFEDWFGTALGTPYSDVIVQQNIGFPAVNVETEFRAPLRFGDTARVSLEVAEVGERSLTCRYTITRLPDGVVSARATIKTVAIDNDTFRSISIPSQWRDRFQAFMNDNR